MDRIEVNVATLPVAQWLERYWRPDRFASLCEACPDHGRVWSCPPGLVSAKEIMAPFSRVHIIGLKVVYRDETRAAASSAEKVEQLRQATYGKAKRVLLESLLELEKALPGSWSLAAGRCELCRRCTRMDGLPCRAPERLRYSLSGFGFDLSDMARQLLDMPLLWAPEGLPEYQVAIAAFLEKQGVSQGQAYVVGEQRPWELFQEEVMGVLRQMGCAVQRRESGERQNVYFDTGDDEALRKGCSGKPLRPCAEMQIHRNGALVSDLSTGDTYTLSFDQVRYIGPDGGVIHSERKLELENETGSGRRLTRLTARLRDCFPELLPFNTSAYRRGRSLLCEKRP